MTCPHFDINIIKRSEGQSAVNAAAYQAGEKLYSEREKKYMYQGTKEDLVLKEIMLPEHAPSEFNDRQTLWNSVENIEPNWNSQLARRMKIALPKELSLDENIALAREYCRKEFVSKGMIVDLAVHDPKPPNHNPHFHVLLTMRPLDENGRWAPKARKEYVLDNDGNRIRGSNGKYKTRKVSTVDWNARGNAEIWRDNWEKLQNTYLERAGRPERVCMKSFERQGIDLIPTVHMGPTATALERKGIRTDVGDLNREIREQNTLIRFLKKTIQNLVSWLYDIRQAIREIEMEPKEIYLVALLRQKFDERAKERFLNWHNLNAVEKARNKDFKRFISIINYMEQTNVLTVEDLEVRLTDIRSKEQFLRKEMRKSSRRIKEIDTIRATMDRRAELDPVHDKHFKMWIGKKAYESKHKVELDEWKRCNRYLRARFANGSCDMKALLQEHSSLLDGLEEMEAQLIPIAEELNMLNDIHWLVRDLLPELDPEKKEIWTEKKEEKRKALMPVKEEHRHSVMERLNEKKGQVQIREEQQAAKDVLQRGKQYDIDIG